MYIYTVAVTIDAEVEQDWLNWMQTTHIPDVMETGYFTEYELLRQVELETTAGKAYQIRYSCLNLDDLYEYWAKCAPQLQADHTNRYQCRFTASRAVFQQLG